MKKRIISGLVAAALLIIVLYSSTHIIKITIVAVVAGCMYEALKCFSMEKEPCFIITGIVSCCIMPFMDRIGMMYFPTFLFLCMAFLACCLVFRYKKISVTHISTMAFLILLIPFCLSHIAYVRDLKYGEYIIWLPILGAFCTDIGAYFVGRAVGGKKLCEGLSPKKTISGSIGGFVGVLVGFCIYASIIINVVGLNIDYVPYFIIALVCGGLSQIGDLTASSLKRLNNIKDFGKIMPGHGGFLDRVDSLIFVSPAVYYIISIFATGIFY